MLHAVEVNRASCVNPLVWLIFVFALYCPATYSNGWEHTSIDFDVLVSALNDANPNLRRRAAESLGFRPQPGATAALLARLEYNESVDRVRQEIYHALGKIGEESALDAIGDCLANEKAIAVKAQCAVALGNYNSPAAERLALKSVQDENQHVRQRAVASLGSFSSAATVQALTEFSRDKDDSIKRTALLSLGRTGSTAATPVLVEALQRSTQREPTLVLLRALTSLANPDAIEVIQAVYRGSDDEATRRHALVAMASTRARGSESYFLDALSSEDHASRILGLVVLRNFGNPGQIPVITEHALLESRDLFGRDSEQLMRDPSRTLDDLQLLNEYLKTIVRLDPGAGERLYAKAAMPMSIPRSSSVALKIAEGFYDARWQSIYGLGYTGTARAVELVAASLQDSDARIRAVATRSMGVLGSSKHIESIEKRLFDRAAEVRWTAARVLGRLNAEESAELIVQALNDPHAQVRLEAVIALGYLGAQAATQKLSELALNDPDPRVQEAAVYAASLIK